MRLRCAQVLAVPFLLSTLLGAPRGAQAVFSPGPDPISGAVVAAQTLSSGTGTIQAGGSLSVSGGTAAVTMNGSSTLVNAGTLQQTGTGRAVDSNTNNLALVIDNSGLMSSAATDAIRVNQANTSIQLSNSGTIQSVAAGQALDWRAVTLASTLAINSSTGQILSSGEDAVRPGVNGDIQNAGLIQATFIGTGSDGVDAGANSGVEIVNSGTISGRHGVTGGAATYQISIDNQTGGLLRGVNGSGINIDGISATALTTVTNAQGATIEGLASSLVPDSDGDGVDVDGVIDLDNAGTIHGFGAKGVDSGGSPNNADGVAAGGGSIVNRATGEIVGSTLLADAPNGNPLRSGNGILVDNGAGGSGVAATQIDNSGLIQGRSGFGVSLNGNFDDTLLNQASGTIRGTGAAPVISSGGGNDRITNLGVIQHDLGAGQTALDAGAGNDDVAIEGGSAVIAGDLDGGADVDALSFDLGSGNAFSYSDSIRNFEAVRVDSGTLFGSASVDLGAPGNAMRVESPGTLAPGAAGAAGRVTLQQGTLRIDGTLAIDLDGLTAGVAGGYDQILLNDGGLEIGSVSVLDIDLGFAPQQGDSFVIIDVAGSSLPIGSFLGLPEATVFLADGVAFAISYIGGTGNDVTLTAVPEPSSLVLVAAPLLALLRRRARRARCESSRSR